MRMKVLVLFSAICTAPQLVSAQTIHVRQTSGGAAILEVQDATVTIRKELSRFKSVVTMATPKGDVLRIAIDPNTGVVATDGTTTMAGAKAMPAGVVMATIRSSRAAKAARALLDKLPLDPNTPAGNMMLLTRALLESAQDDGLSALRHQEWARATTKARAVGNTDKDVTADLEEEEETGGPGACWYEYAHDAVEIFDDYIHCLEEIQWYDFFGEYRCDAVYILRAELAFMWLINCSGPFPFKG